MRLSEEVINSIRESADIVEVISHYIPVSRKGKSYTAVCPFHDDHDPSLSISPDKQIYKCFVCGNGGNVFSFVMNYKKCSFLEAVVEVSRLIGKPLEIETESKPQKRSPYQPLYDALKEMSVYGNYLLSGSVKGKAASEYLSARGIDAERIEKFQIGYNPEGNLIYTNLKNKNFNDETLIDANIIRMNEYGISEVFQKRILFPIEDPEGRTVAFTARDFSGFSQSKYINSAETKVYVKGNVLYNYHRAKDYAKASGYLIVVEGVMDVIAFDRADLYNCVATLGTACSKEQLQLLLSLSKKIVLAYDGDRAGKNANLKVGEMLIELGAEVSVIDNNTGLDPDEIINKYQKNGLRDLSSRRLSYPDYVLKFYKENANLDNFSDRKQLNEKVGALIGKLKDPDERENYYRELYELTRIRRRNEETFTKIAYNKETVIDYSLDGLTKAEYTILSQMAISRKASQLYQRELGSLLSEEGQKLSLLMIDEYRKAGSCSLAKLFDEISDEKIRQLIVNISTWEGLPEEYSEELLLGAIEKVKVEIKQKRIAYLKKEIAASIDPATSRRYLDEYMRLLQEIGGSYGKK